jgi:cell division protein FtsZ
MEDKKNNQVMYESELGIMSTLDKSQQRTIIRAIGVGGGGIHAVNHMYLQGIEGVTFVVSDTDRHFLNASPVPNRILLRSDITYRSATEERKSEIAALFDDDTKMVIIIAGMGGGTGTWAAPAVARIAREKEVTLTVGIVTIPFQFEGSDKILKALDGIEELSKHVDALFVIDNQRLTEIHKDLDRTNAFAKSDETLSTAARSLCDLITVKNKICLDFNDVNYTLRKGGNAFIVSGFGWGESRVTKALQNALESPLLKGCDVFSSQKILMNFYYNSDSEFPLLMEEMIEIQEFMKNFDEEVDVIWGMSFDNKLVDQIKVTILATGFNVSYKSDIKPLKNMLSQNS